MTGHRSVSPRDRRRAWLLQLALTAGYVAVGSLSLKLAILNDSASAVWPPAGLALAALPVFGARVWPGVAG